MDNFADKPEVSSSRYEVIVNELQQKPWFPWLLRQAQKEIAERKDPSHDIGHVFVTLATAIRLGVYMEEKRGWTIDYQVVAAAALCHDLVVRKKDDPNAKNDTEESAELAQTLLEEAVVRHEFPSEGTEIVCGIVRNCSVSRGGEPKSREEMLVRDADLLECVGARGVARFFISSGMMNRAIIDLSDPRAKNRKLEIWKNVVDAMWVRGIQAARAHLYTDAAKSDVLQRAKLMEQFISSLVAETSGLEGFVTLLDKTI